MLLTILTYVAVVVLYGVLSAVVMAVFAYTLFKPYWLLARRLPFVAVPAAFLQELLSALCILLLLGWLANKLGIQLTGLMFFILYLGITRNHWRRLTLIDKGLSATAVALRSLDEPYDARLEKRMEYAYWAGESVGFFAIPLFVWHLPFS